MNNTKNKIENIPYIYFFIISLCKGLGLDIRSKIYFLLYLLAIFLGAVKIIKTNYSKKGIFSIIFIILIGIICYITNSETTILFSSISLLLIKDCKIKKVIKYIMYGRLLGFIIMILGSLLGFIDIHPMIFYRPSLNTYINRYTFGYSSPNLAHSTFNFIIMMWLYVYYEKINAFNIIFLMIINLILFNYTASRTGFIILAFFLILIYLTKKSDKLNRFLPKILNATFFGMIILSFLLAYLYGKIDFVNTIDKYLTGRVNYLNYTLLNFPIQLINTNNYGDIIFDNGYFDLIYQCGLLPFIWFFIFQIKTNNYLKKNNMYRESLFTFILFIYCFVESYYASVIMNISLLFFSFVLFKNNNIEN